MHAVLTWLRQSLGHLAGAVTPRINRFLTTLRAIFEPALDCWKVLKLCRVSAVTVLLVGYVLIFVPEGQEVLLLLLNRHNTFQFVLANGAFFFSVLVWATLAWYWSRIILSFRFEGWPPPGADAQRLHRIWVLHRWVPRILGTAVLVVTAVAIGMAALTYETGGHSRLTPWLALAEVVLYGAFSMVFFLFVVKRQKWSHQWGIPYAGWVNPGDALYESRNDLPRASWRVLLGSLLVLSLLMFLIFQYRPFNLALAPYLRAPTILVLAAAAWVPVGTVLVYWGANYRIPVFTLMLVYVTVISLWIDNHPVREVKVTPSQTETRVRHSVTNYFNAWITAKRRDGDAEDRIPVVIVAAEGGGIRAAYWTGMVLARIQHDQPTFASHVFVISGVSGGSLGAGVFTALMAGRNDPDSACRTNDQLPECVHAILSEDFLAPTFATMLYPDLVQRFWPISVDYWDRGRTLEESWERAWTNVTKTTRFQDPLENLWSNDPHYQVPSLVLNGTAVEFGTRILTSNLLINEDIFADVIDFHQAFNPHDFNVPNRRPLPSRTIALSTAILNSARFTYVSPAGRVNERLPLHVVDGGYYDNSGATTAKEIYIAIKDRPGISPHIYPIMLHISNEPERELTGTMAKGPKRSRTILPETVTPVKTFLKVWDAHSHWAVMSLQKALMEDELPLADHLFHFGLKQTNVSLPLGWALAQSATDEMKVQLAHLFWRCPKDSGTGLVKYLQTCRFADE